MENRDKFEKILDDDEQVVSIIKPNKTKFYFSLFFSTLFIVLWFLIFVTIAVFVPDDNGETIPLFSLVFALGFLIVLEFVIYLFGRIYYKNVFYAYTNKRVIIRKGIFGIDFKSLDMSMIGAVDVYVSLFDKILRKDTGTICFGSTASPIVNNANATSYKFSHIVMPYETCKKIKIQIDEYKNSKR